MSRRIQSTLTTLLVAALGFTMAGTALAQDETGRVRVKMPSPRAMSGYLKVGDIKGESVDKDHKDWIDVLSVDWGAHEPGRRGTAESGEVVIVRHVDKASPKLFEHIAQGKHLPAIELHTRTEQAGDAGRATYYAYELQNARISSYHVDASGDRPTETITLNYAKIDASPGMILKGKKIHEN